VAWHVQNGDCTVTGTNGDVWTGIESGDAACAATSSPDQSTQDQSSQNESPLERLEAFLSNKGNGGGNNTPQKLYCHSGGSIPSYKNISTCSYVKTSDNSTTTKCIGNHTYSGVVSSPITEQTVYNISCSGPGGTITNTATVNIIPLFNEQ